MARAATRGLVALAVIAAGLLFSKIYAANQTTSFWIGKQPLAERAERPIIGIGVHFGIGGEYGYSPQKTALTLRSDAFDSVRDDLAWSLFQAGPTIGNAATQVAREPAKLFDFLDRTQARPLLILGHPNPLVPDGQPPLTDVGRKSFGDFAAKAVQATAKRNPIYEIWNEWNMNAVLGRPFLVGEGDPSDPRAAANYSALAKEALARIRSVAPQAQVLVGAVGMDPDWKWTMALVRSGALDGASGLSVHLYNHCEREVSNRTAEAAIHQVSSLRKLLDSAGSNIPIFVTEVGWPTTSKTCPISTQTAANNIAQFLFWTAATPWIKGAWIYEMKDQGSDPTALEDNFGLYDYAFSPKPAACATREAIAIIKSMGPMRLEQPLPGLFVVEATTPGGKQLIAWTSQEKTSATLEFPNDTKPEFAPLCQQKTTSSTIRLGATPVAITLPTTAPFELKATLNQ
ncbi:glycoside hydrolase family 5 protein [Bradyrhizobium sp. Bra78]|uniref:glycoside hydrolase family 5 protein n=1 Tax=Bradyrhizobium sp. Bra78 TaxID=2926010 RepID=UPI0021C6FB0F|nr:glycoside hydrolase family 5 protein [Bradyrhizobium sp. Bra78]